jgi:plastocyanin
MNKASRWVYVGFIFLNSLGSAALAATTTVYIVNYDFVDSSAAHINPTITLGDTVTWVWNAAFHSTTAAAGQLDSWNSGVVFSSGATYSHTFSQLGTFNYFCSIHGADGGCRSTQAMSGYVAVVLPGSPPYQITGITQQGNDLLVTWVTGGICQSNVLQRAMGAADGSYTNNFADIFTIPSTAGNSTNYLDVGAATNFPIAYYRVLIPNQ